MKVERFEDLPQGARFDCVVVGSGFGGSVAALRLAEKGYRVAVLESGRHFADDDFPRTNWDLRRYLWAPALGCLGIQRLTFLEDALILSGAGVGGGSLVYAATLLEPGARFYGSAEARRACPDLEERLRPHFRTARRMLGVAETPRLGPADEALRGVALEMGRGSTFRRTEVGIHFGEPGRTVRDPYFGGEGPDRTACLFCGGCMVGCRHGAKNTLAKNYLHLASRRGARVFELSQAASLSRLGDGSYRVAVRRPGSRRALKSVDADAVFVSAGVLGTLRLLLDPATRLPGLPRGLGRDVRTNAEVLIGSTARDGAADRSEGVAIGSGFWPDDDTHVEAVRYPAGSDAMALLGVRDAGGSGRLGRLARLAASTFTAPRDALRLAWPFGWAKRSTILLCMQPVESRLKLGLKRGLFGPRLASEPEPGSPPPPLELPAASEALRRFAAATGGIPQASAAASLLGLTTTAHILGGAPLGREEDGAAVDVHGRVFGAPGLWILDGSIVPANLGVNPSLTITALAEHALSAVPPKPGA